MRWLLWRAWIAPSWCPADTVGAIRVAGVDGQFQGGYADAMIEAFVVPSAMGAVQHHATVLRHEMGRATLHHDHRFQKRTALAVLVAKPQLGQQGVGGGKDGQRLGSVLP